MLLSKKQIIRNIFCFIPVLKKYSSAAIVFVASANGGKEPIKQSDIKNQ